MGIIEDGPLKGERGAVAGVLEVTSRESNWLTTLKVLEMICDLLLVCALGRGVRNTGGREPESQRAREQESKRGMAVANANFLPPRGRA